MTTTPRPPKTRPCSEFEPVTQEQQDHILSLITKPMMMQHEINKLVPDWHPAALKKVLTALLVEKRVKLTITDYTYWSAVTPPRKASINPSSPTPTGMLEDLDESQKQLIIDALRCYATIHRGAKEATMMADILAKRIRIWVEV